MTGAPSDLDRALETLTQRRATTLARRRVSLQVVSGKDAGRRFEFDGRARIGTRRLADLVLADPRVSGLHCEIFAVDELRLRDLGSKNGTFLGGYRVIEATIPGGETIALGDTRIRVVPIDELVDVPLSDADDFFGLIGQSAAMRALTARIERLSAVDSPVLIVGETGSGKERVAEALHLSGARAAQPLVIVDCGALRGEAELDAALARAQGGTLFLDDVGELALDLQTRLAAALHGAAPRIIAATGRDLPLEVQRGRFREELYYRVAVVTLTVPPLRERLDDLPFLAVHLLGEMGIDPASCLTVEALGALAQHDWPGNVRELRNTLERAAALMEPLTPGGVQPAPPELPPAAVDLRQPLRTGKQRVIEAFERAYVSAMLTETGNNISETARRAGMDRMSIHRILQRLGMRGT
ncbi:MAG TPA: sigma 54-interacting transcriptional regulator [Kofleriaceae bacterium]|nr:sigma 54-interacting transcriptional regulator [Kofleriaceae bacterium]